VPVEQLALCRFGVAWVRHHSRHQPCREARCAEVGLRCFSACSTCAYWTAPKYPSSMRRGLAHRLLHILGAEFLSGLMLGDDDGELRWWNELTHDPAASPARMLANLPSMCNSVLFPSLV